MTLVKPNRAFCSIVNHLNSSNNVAKFKVGSFFFYLQAAGRVGESLKKSQNLLFIKHESVDCEIIINFQFVLFSSLL